MECKDCKYLFSGTFGDKTIHGCTIQNFAPFNGYPWCGFNSEEDINKAEMCFNCKHWIGGGDFGLTCAKDYYMTNANGLQRICDKFIRKE